MLKEDNSLHYYKHLPEVDVHVKFLLADYKGISHHMTVRACAGHKLCPFLLSLEHRLERCDCWILNCWLLTESEDAKGKDSSFTNFYIIPVIKAQIIACSSIDICLRVNPTRQLEHQHGKKG